MALYCPWETVTCNSCNKDITSATRVACMECENFDLCLECFSQGKEIGKHLNCHRYRIIPSLHFPLLTNDWGADEEFMLLQGIEEKGIAKGREAGREEGRIEGEAGPILKMHKNGLSAEQIASATDKPLEEVAKIIAGKTSTQG